MGFLVNGSDITSNWEGTTISQSGETGFHENGEDLAQRYSQCGNANCSTNYSPICESIPSEYDPKNSYSFWTGDCQYIQ